MSFRQVEPAQAVEWIRRAVQLLLAQPAPFLLMGLVLSLLAFVPLLGAFVLLIAGPVFYAGIASAARTQAEGGTADFNQLMEGFRQPGKAGPLITLCLPSLGLMFALVMIGLMVALSFGAAAALASQGQPIDPTQVSLVSLFGVGGLVVLALLAIPLALATGAMLFFAVPRVMFDGVEPFAALRESAQACTANLGAFLLTVIALFFARALVALVLGSLVPILGAMVAGVVFTPLIGAVLYVAWADVFPRGGASGSGADSAPHAPPVIEV